MRWFFFLIAGLSALFLVYSVVHLTQRLQKPAVHLVSEDKILRLKKLSPSGSIPTQTAVDVVKGSPAEEQQTNSNKNTYFWLSFLATALTAAAGLVSGIQAAVNNPARAKATAIIVAVLTFLGTMTNTAASHFNDSASYESSN